MYRARLNGPFAVLFEQDGVNEPDNGFFVGGYSNDLGPPLDFAVGVLMIVQAKQRIQGGAPKRRLWVAEHPACVAANVSEGGIAAGRSERRNGTLGLARR